MKNVNLIFSSSHKKGRVYYQITKKYRKTKINLSFCKGFRYLFPKKNYFYFIKNDKKMKLTRIDYGSIILPLRIIRLWRVGRVVEGARLEIVFRLKPD